MKKSLKVILLVFVSAICANISFAQIDYSADARYMKFGVSPEDRKLNHENYLFFMEEMKSKAYDSAEKRLTEILAAAPGGSENLYIRGRQLYILRLKQATTPEKIEEYVEKMVLLQEIRNAHFGHVAARGSKEIYKTRLMDFMQHRPESVERILKYADDAISAAGVKVDPSMIAQIFNTISNAYMNDLLSPDIYLEQYEFMTNALSKATDPSAANSLKDCDAIFAQSGAADCTNIEKIYKPKYMAAPDDMELVKKIMSYLLIGNCDGDFRIELSEKLFTVNPTTSSAFMLGVTFANAGDFVKGKSYMLKAVELETDPIEKSKYLVRLAATSLGNKDVADAVKYSKMSITNDNTNGLAYLILGQAYGAASLNNPCSGVASKSVYWVIVDNLSRAARLLSDDADQVKNINTLISSYSQYFPTTEELFFDPNIKVGKKYVVNCGLISGTTTVRAAK